MLDGIFGVLSGTLLLYFGANSLIKGSSGLARSCGVAPAIIGLTVVAFGTSLPELVVSLTAAFRGNADIALGNVVGSNVANIGLILGTAACIRCMQVEFTLVRREAPMGLGAVVFVVLLSLDGTLGRVDGVLLLVGFTAFLYWSMAVERVAPESIQEACEEVGSTGSRRGRDLLLSAAGLVGVVLGGHFLVEGAVDIAHLLGVPTVIVGLTVVALGSSLPELATTLVAVSRNEDDLSVGNVMGSNLFNLLLILGVASVFQPIWVPASFYSFQYPVLAAYTLALLPICRSGFCITRTEGAVLLGSYVAYVATLYLVPGVQ